jgi:endonuclease III related protein
MSTDHRERCRIRSRGDGPFLVVDLYNALFDAFGPQRWWPADTPFEVMVGAILTQNTGWTNVERAIDGLKAASLLQPDALALASPALLEQAIRPAGYYRQKAARLRLLADWFQAEWAGDVAALAAELTLKLRQMLLELNGVGPETADSILLYAVGKPVFVIDAYTIRIVGRVGLSARADYAALQQLFQRNLPVDIDLYREYHALLVALGKDYCRPRIERSRCSACPVGSRCETGLLAAVCSRCRRSSIQHI